MYATRPSRCKCIESTSSLVLCLVSLLLYASFQSLFVMLEFIAHLFSLPYNRSHCFYVAVSVAIFLYWRYSVYTPPSVTVDCRQLLPNSELYCSKLIPRIIPRRSGPITFLSGFPGSISAGYVFVVMLIRRMPQGFLPVPPRRRIALRPSLLMSCILFVFELSQG